MSVLRQQRRVSLRLQREQLNLRLLFETYTSKFLPPHTLPLALSMPLTKLYIYRAVNGRWALFSWCVYLTYWKKKTREFIEAQCGPLVTDKGSTGALQRFFFWLPQPAASAVLSFCSHTVWAFTVKSAAHLRKMLHTEVASKGLQSSIWRGRWFTMLASLISQWVKNICSVFMVLIALVQIMTLWLWVAQ